MRPCVLLLLLLRAVAAAVTVDHDMALIPAGEFLMGSDDGGADEAPAHRVYLDAYYIDRHEVTNSEFAQFVRASAAVDSIEGPWFRYFAEGCLDVMAHYEARYGVALEELDLGGDHARFRDASVWRAAVAALRMMLGNDNGSGLQRAAFASDPKVLDLIKRQARLPVREVTWRDAASYARWAGKRLPTEAEWEKAARGVDGRRFPWGSEWDPKRCRAGLEPEAGPAPVGEYAGGASPYGVVDMAGNVWEWIADWYGEDYYTSSRDSRNPKGPEGLGDGRLPGPSKDVNLLRSAKQGRESNTRKVIRGGGWAGPPLQARFNTRCTRRLWSNPSYWHPDVGFRCAKDAK